MNAILPSEAEKRAQPALDLQALGGLNLTQTRRDVTDLLALIGTRGIFEEYTKHDITHVDAMLALLDWIIPGSTKDIMTPTDWLLIVLATYLHDLGMLVTKEEYRQRNSSGFIEFRDHVLLTNDDAGNDYAARLNRLSPDKKEQFLYQEYVRGCHASRIGNWIRGDLAPHLGVAEGVVNELRRILGPLNEVFRDDLAVVCESHQDSDLYNVHKYSVSKPYGSHREEAANIQYAAVLLRTIDLLHITSDRTPPIAARLTNPADPVSQTEWAKQGAVRAVRDQFGANEKNELDENASRDTVEVHATFSNSDGFFGLTSYLVYAEAELRQSHDWISDSNRLRATKHEFPWRRIDTNRIEARGFLAQTFEFKIDQAKILDLLTGHTLYNDSGVVLRELLQNSIDAVRFHHGSKAMSSGRVVVKWNASSRILEVHDNGTGMSLEIIENNFLHVGSSRYQDPQFQEQNPNFNPISRFGIGVLSTFMIADEVEVITCLEGELKAHELSLRSVHGKYLIRILDKYRDAMAQPLGEHGTIVRLTVRPSVGEFDVLQLAKRWAIMPGCLISIEVEGSPPTTIGFQSVESALESGLRDLGYNVGEVDETSESRIRIASRYENGVSLAYAVRWDDYFKQWGFLYEETDRPIEALSSVSGTCVEGIKVEFTPPGFRTDAAGPIALCDLRGMRAPRTNVARSAIEWTSEHRAILDTIYRLYCAHIAEEIDALQNQRNHSLTWAVGEGAYLAADLINPPYTRGGTHAISQPSLERAVMTIPLYTIEVAGERRAVSSSELQGYDYIWSVESAFTRYIEYLLREMPGSVSLSQLLRALGQDKLLRHEDLLLCSDVSHGPRRQLLEKDWQVAEFRAIESERRCDARWVRISSGALWSTLEPVLRSGAYRPILQETDVARYGSWENSICIPLGPIKATGFTAGENAVTVSGQTYLLPGHPWEELLTEGSHAASTSLPVESITREVVLSLLLTLSWQRNVFGVQRSNETAVAPLRRTALAQLIDLDRFVEISHRNKLRVFDTSRWQRP